MRDSLLLLIKGHVLIMALKSFCVFDASLAEIEPVVFESISCLLASVLLCGSSLVDTDLHL